MKRVRWITAYAVIFLPALTCVAAESAPIITYHEAIRIVSSPESVAASSQKSAVSGSAALVFDALGRRFELELESNDRLFGPAALASRSAGIAVYKGRLSGQADSWVRITIAKGEPRGLIWDGTELFAIEAPGDSALETPVPVIFRLSDTYIQPGMMSCGAATPAASGETVYGKLMGELGNSFAQAPGATVEIEIGAIGDFEFTDNMGASAEAAILTRLNNVDGIFSSQAGVQISIPDVTLYTTASDPFTDTDVPGELLDELGMHRQITPSQLTKGLTHLYTGRNLAGTTVGIAYTGALCSPRFGVGLSEGRSGATTDSLVAAHEIGHNFDAPHDGDAAYACAAEPETFIMAPSINGSNQFSQCSIGIIQQSAASAACVSALPTTDMTIELRGQAPSALLGGSVTMNFDATNLGSQAATTVEVDISIPANFTFVSASSTAGSCTNGAGTVSCSIGSVAGGSTATVALSTIANDTNSGTFVATVSSDVDDDLGNNQESVVVTPLPAVDMAATTPNATVVINQATTAQTTIANLNSVDASNVVVGIALDNGIRADSASWTAGNCTVSANQVDCQASSFAGQSSSTLTLGLTGLTTGQSGYTMTLSSSGNDANPDNNSASGNVTVNAVSSNDPGGSSGSGSAGPLFLGLLAMLTLARRRTRREIPAS